MLIQRDPQAQRLDAILQSLFEDQFDLQLQGFLKEIVNTSFCLEQLRFQPRVKSKINILLCDIVFFSNVTPMLKNDAMNLVAYCVTCSYMKGNGVFYMALVNNEGKIVDVMDDIIIKLYSAN